MPKLSSIEKLEVELNLAILSYFVKSPKLSITYFHSIDK